jgi:hypothetical protein
MYSDIVHVFAVNLVLLLTAYLQCLALPSYHLYICLPLPNLTRLSITQRLGLGKLLGAQLMNIALAEFLLVLLWAFNLKYCAMQLRTNFNLLGFINHMTNGSSLTCPTHSQPIVVIEKLYLLTVEL